MVFAQDIEMLVQNRRNIRPGTENRQVTYYGHIFERKYGKERRIS